MLRNEGHQAVVFDRSHRLGGSWPTRYDALRLNTVRWMSDLPGLRASSPDRWLTRDQMTLYLESYVEWHGLEVHLGVGVSHIEPSADGRWRCRLTEAPPDSASEAGPGSHLIENFHTGEAEWDALVVATGASVTNTMPDWPGVSEFAGTLLHSGDYRSADRLPPGTVLVVGAGSSGAEIASDLAHHGRQVIWSVRTAPGLAPREIRSIPVTPLGVPADLMPGRLVDAAMSRLERAAYGARDYLPAASATVTQLMRRYKEPLTADDIVAQIRSGEVRVVGAVRDLHPHGAVVDDGELADAEVVIAATGHRTGLGELVGHLDVLDELERPISAVPRPRLGFIGFRVPLTGTLWAIDLDARDLATDLLA